jgi:ABC-type spermidine/putrescine transport system permease subunit I
MNPPTRAEILQRQRAAVIEIALANPAQLLRDAAATPFGDGMLVPDAAAFIAGEAKHLPPAAPLRVRLLLPAALVGEPAASRMAPAVTSHFAGLADATSAEIRELFRDGRATLVVGLSVLVACLGTAFAVSGFAPSGPGQRIAQESLVILGWVSMWRPAEIFIYGWVPIMQRRKLLRRLAAAEVVVLPQPGRP